MPTKHPHDENNFLAVQAEITKYIEDQRLAMATPDSEESMNWAMREQLLSLKEALMRNPGYDIDGITPEEIDVLLSIIPEAPKES